MECGDTVSVQGVSPGSSSSQAPEHRKVVVFDCRPERTSITKKVLDIAALDFGGFLCAVAGAFSFEEKETFILTTTDRKQINSERFAELKDGNTLHLLSSIDQALSSSTKEQIIFLPHYDTIVQSGMYEYYASEGQTSLPYAFAELIDNSLSATVESPGERSIEIQLLLDESQGRPAVIVLDNGCGMTSKQLNNWAIYRLSKFNRENSAFQSDHMGYSRPAPVPRSLNSDISYFGVGGKQAVFYIGQSTRMITKPKGSPDVHELVLSKEEFEKRERNKEDIYCGYIRNRKPGDSSHITSDDDRFLHSLISQEVGKSSFTAVVVTGVQLQHIVFLKNDFHAWTRELAHMYHYYIHGIHGNNFTKPAKPVENVNKINVEINLQVKPSKPPKTLNLRDVTDDMQTLYINSCADAFEFRAHVDENGIVEGLIRYHPFLYDRETYPEDPFVSQPVNADEEDEDGTVGEGGRGKRPIFECFWNGRLIPYTTVAEFEWCTRPKKGGQVPQECYNRISGVLFTNDHFQVSTNKLTFMDLELQLRNKETIFTRVVNGQEQRVKIQKEFTQWLKECHEKWDKQMMFVGFKGTMTRTDIPVKKMQSPWAIFTSIEWDGRTYTTGQYVKSIKTHPIIFGTIHQFLLYGNHDGDIYATGGQVQVTMEPKALYDEVRTIPISKIDRTTPFTAIKKYISDELAKLPDRLKVTWPEGNKWNQDDVRPAGSPFGPIQIEILNKKGESMMRMPGTNHTAGRKLLMELKVVWHSPDGDVETNSHISQHGGKWPYWFKTMENLNKLGKYTLSLQTLLNESQSSTCASRPLPSHSMRFSICEGQAERFTIGTVKTFVHIGESFSIPLTITDAYGHPTQPPPDLKPCVLCSGFEITYEKSAEKGTNFNIEGVKVMGKVKNYHGKTYTVKVTLPGLKQETQAIKINFIPGHPHCLNVKPEDEEISVENGTPVSFQVEVHDKAGNVTAQPKLIVRCQFSGAPDLPIEAVDFSNSGTGLLMCQPLCVKNVQAGQTITATLDIPSCKNIAAVQRVLKITPSSRVARLEIYSLMEGEDVLLKDGEKIDWTAGDVLQNLHYRLYDEANRLVPLTDALAKKIRVTWNANMKDLEKGRLPNILVPTVVKDDQFCHVTVQDKNFSISSSFTITPRPDEPKRIKVTWKGENTARMGEVMAAEIYLDIVDQYGNKTPTLTPACVDSTGVSAEGLDKSSLNVIWEESLQSIAVQGIRFTNGDQGPRELCFAWRNFAECQRINVISGPPTKLELLDKPEEPLQVFNGKDIETPLVVQLCDEWGNPSPDQRIIISMKPSSSDLKIKVSPSSQPADPEGRASFIVKQVTAPKGEYSLQFRCTFSKQLTTGLTVKLKVMPDPNKPVKLVVNYDTKAVYPAGGILTDYAVAVVSEDGNNICGMSPASITMLMWKGESSGPRPPPGACTLKCSKPLESETEGFFYFRDKVIPDHVGKYTIQFVFCVDKTKGLWSNQYVINVVPNQPDKLMPDSLPPTPVVSNIQEAESRTLVKSMTLRIVDKYDNPTGDCLDGDVVVSIRSPSSKKKELPVFEKNTDVISFPLRAGVAEITDLTVNENSPGVDGTEYLLSFKATVPKVSTVQNEAIKPFVLSFMFYNDSKNQQQMAALTKKKDRLSQSIMAYRSLFETNNQLVTELKDQLKDATQKESQIKLEIKKRGINEDQIVTVEAIDGLIGQKKAEQERILKQPRRICTMPNTLRSNTDVLGKVAHLARVESDDVARVLSWHLSGDMDCVVTLTTAAARQIYDNTNGRQQVLPLDSVYWRNNCRPLPHIKNGISSFQPIGNPVFARDLLIFPEHVESCKMVFGNLLGDTILVDSLDAANHYRKSVIQTKMPCPTLLTRQGERVRSNGKFGGLQNNAPPMEKMQGQVFAAPLPKHYYTLSSRIELLQQYRLTLLKMKEVKDDYETHMHYLQSPEMVQKKKEMSTQEVQLKDIEKKLGMSKSRKSDVLGAQGPNAGDVGFATPKRSRRHTDVPEPHGMSKRKKTL